MDPLEVAIIALITAGTGKAVDGIVALGKKSAPTLWSALSQKGKKQFEVNLKNFGAHLVTEVRQRVDSGQLSQEQIAAALDQPDLVSLLINTLTQAAQTGSAEAQKLLAKVIAERLGADPESELALVTPMACEAITRLNARHLKLLALRYIFAAQRYNATADSSDSDEATLRMLEVEWLIRTFEPYQDLVASTRDAEHLEAVGCVGGSKARLAEEIKSALIRMVSPELDLVTFRETTTWRQLESVWNDARLAVLVFTSVGSLIGMYTSDILANRPTDIDQWLYRH